MPAIYLIIAVIWLYRALTEQSQQIENMKNIKKIKDGEV